MADAAALVLLACNARMGTVDVAVRLGMGCRLFAVSLGRLVERGLVPSERFVEYPGKARSKDQWREYMNAAIARSSPLADPSFPAAVAPPSGLGRADRGRAMVDDEE